MVSKKLNNLQVNVFGYENDEICSSYISPREDDEAINLLIISDDKEKYY